MIQTLFHSLRLNSMFRVFLFSVFFFIFQNGFTQNPGNLDVTFNPIDNGFGVGDGANNSVIASAIQSDGKIIISGTFSTYNGIAKTRIVRLNVDGSIDSTFNVGTGLDNSANSIVVQPDGKIVIGGYFASYNGISRNRIVRLNTDGTIDTTFNPGTGIGTGFSNIIHSVVLQSDGKIIIGGAFTTYNGTTRNNIARLNSNGSLDTSFNPGTGTNNTIRTVCLQLDGKILIGGIFSLFNGTLRDKMARLNSNGAIDTTFIPPAMGAIAGVYSVALQSDGKVVIGGTFSFLSDSTRRQLGRLNVDGSIDTAFNPGSATDFDISSVVVQLDGKMLIGGNFTSYNGTGVNSIARVNTDGTLDTSFNIGTIPNAKITTILLQPNNKIVIGGDFSTFNNMPRNYITRLNATGDIDTSFNQCLGANKYVSEIVIQPDNKILIGGDLTSYNDTIRNKIARLNEDGSLDTSFNASIMNLGCIVRAVALQPDGKILIGGSFSGIVPQANLYRLNADGTLDSTFIEDATISNSGSVYAITLLPDGKILIGGNFAKGIVLLNSDGSLDTTFDAGTGISSSSEIIHSIALQSDGKIIVVGTFNSFSGASARKIIRLNTNGSIDASFNVSGSGTGGWILTVVVQPDDKILIGGNFSDFNNINRYRIARLNADGSLDTNFNSPIMSINYVDSIVLQNNGKIIVGGSFYLNNGLVLGISRMNLDGSLDTTFDVGTGTNNSINAIALQSDDKVLIGGNFTAYNGIGRTRIARIHGGEIPDPLFNPGTGANDKINTIAIQPNRNILIGGSFTSFNGININRIAGLRGDGNLNTSFNVGTGVTNEIKSIVLKTNGKVIIGGGFTSYNGTSRNNIVGLDENGVLDIAFNIGTGTNGTVNCIVLQPDGKIIIGGSFTSYNGISRSRIARLNIDGSLDTTFNPGTGPNSDVRSIAVQQNGKILIGGDFTTYNGSVVNYFTCLNSNGTKDNSFNIGGNSANNSVNAIVLKLDGKIIIGGSFSSFNGVSKEDIASLNSDGSLDLSFVGTGTNDGDIQCIVLLVNGKIIIGGNFTSYSGITRNRIAGLNSDGTIDMTIDFGSGANDTVNCIALQSNGKIVIGGAFTSFDNTIANRIVQINASNLGTEDYLLRKIKVYPNPVVDFLHFDFPENITIDNFAIYDLLGKQVISESRKVNDVNVSNLKSGIYILRIKSNEGELIKKFVKE